MKKRILSIAVVLCLAICLFTVTAGAVETHTHCVCGANDCSGAGHDHSQVWTEWTDALAKEQYDNSYSATNCLPKVAGYYYLTADVVLYNQCEPADGTVLCLNGHSITINESEPIIYVGSGVTFTLTDCGTETREGYIDATTNLWTAGAEVPEGAVEYDLTGGIITGGNSSGIYIDNGTFNMYGGNIAGNSSASGAGVSVSGGTFNMSGGTISGNEATTGNIYDGGGGVIVAGGTFNMSGTAKITENTATNAWGGGVYVSNGSFTLSGTAAVTGNSAKNGGGVSTGDSASTFTMTGGTITSNAATFDGGGVFMANGTFNMSGGTVSSNTAGQYGGGVRMNDGTFNMFGTAEISGNKAHSYGGGVRMDNGTFNISGSPSITGNTVNTGTAKNVRLNTGMVITVTDELTTDTNIGVSMKKYGVLTSGWNNHMSGVAEADIGQYFTADDNTKVFSLVGGEVKLAVPHTHDWEYTYADGTITATCGVADCPLPESRCTATVTVSSATYIPGLACPVMVDETGWVAETINKSDNGFDPEDGVLKGSATITVGGDKLTFDVPYTVEKANVTIAFAGSYNPSGMIYSNYKLGNPGAGYINITSDAAVTYNDIVFTWYKNAECTQMTTAADGAAQEGGAPKNAGTYYVKASFAGNDFAKAAFAISDKAHVIAVAVAEGAGLTIYLDGTSYPYTGEPITPAVTSVKWVSTEIPTDEYTVSYSNNTNAGTATVTITDKDGGNYTVNGSTTFTIITGQGTVSTAPVAKTGLKYTGEALALVTAGTATNGTMQYKVGESGEWSAEIPTATDAGEYTVYYKVVGNANYSDSVNDSFKVEVNIAKAENSYVSEPAGKTGLVYTSMEQALIDVSGRGEAKGGTIRYRLGVDGEYSNYTDNIKAKNAGTYTVYYKVVGGDNYEDIAERSFTVEIKKADLTVSEWPTVNGTVYVNGTLSLTGGTVSGKGGDNGGNNTMSGWSCEISNRDLTSAGTKTITVTIRATGQYENNYNPAVNDSFQITVVKRQVTAVTNPAAITDKDYGTAQGDLGLPTEVTITASGDRNFTVPVNWSGYDPNTLTEQTLVGTLDLSAPAIAAEVEQADPAMTASVNVTLKKLTAESFTFENKTAAYTGSPIEHGIASLPEGVVSVAYSYVGDDYDSADAPTNAGTYSVTATFTMGTYYNDVAAKNATLTIAQAEVAEPIVSGEYTYTGADQTATLSGLEAYMTVTGGNVQRNAGEHDITVTLDANHKWAAGSDGTVKWNIAKAKVDIPAADSAEYTYNGAAQTYILPIYAEYTISETYTQTNAGTYTITITLNDTDNNEWSDGTTDAKNYTFTIAKATVTVAAKDQNIYVGAEAPDLSAPVEGTHYTVTGLFGEDTINLSGIAMGYDPADPDTSAAGTFEITVSGADGGTNYNVAYTAGTLTVSNRSVAYSNPTYKVEDKTPENSDGSVTIGKDNAQKGEKVTITVTPDSYYKTEKVIVKDKNGIEIEVTANEDGTYSFVMPAGGVTIEPVFSWDNPFVDVAEDTFYTDAVEWALKNGITEGTDETTFSPAAACTRAQMMTFLWRAAGSPEPKTDVCAFTDVDLDSYYAKAVLWAIENGITNGTSDTAFSPDMECSRAQMAAFLCRLADGEAVSDENAFVDVEDDAYYAESVQWAVENGITEGIGDNRFSPDAVCTRAQIVTFLYRYFVK